MFLQLYKTACKETGLSKSMIYIPSLWRKREKLYLSVQPTSLLCPQKHWKLLHNPCLLSRSLFYKICYVPPEGSIHNTLCVRVFGQVLRAVTGDLKTGALLEWFHTKGTASPLSVQSWNQVHLLQTSFPLDLKKPIWANEINKSYLS